MSEFPLISIVIPLYNKEGVIEKTLDSILRQTFNDYEVVVVNDGSTDASQSKVEGYSKKVNKLRIVSQANSGVGAARNHGIRIAKGKYISFLDADDEWDPEYLSTQVSLIKDFPMCDVFATSYSTRNSEGTCTPAKIDYTESGIDGKRGVLNNYFKVASASNPPLWTSAVIVSKEAATSIDPFPENVKSGEDLLTWARLASEYKIAYNKAPLAFYNLGHSNPRPPERKDYVGKEIQKLNRKYPHTPGLKEYLGNWHKMRMCRCLGHRMYGEAFKSFSKAVAVTPLNPHLYHSFLKFFLIGLKH